MLSISFLKSNAIYLSKIPVTLMKLWLFKHMYLLYYRIKNFFFFKFWAHKAGADPGFQVRGGALKKNAPSRERR